MERSYSELITFNTFTERLEYLKLLDNNVNSPRHMSMPFYKSRAWKTTRDMIIERDLGFDLGAFGVYIIGPIHIHHINPITEYDIRNFTDKLLDPENLIMSSANTHNLIHYRNVVEEKWVERKPGDTKLW